VTGFADAVQRVLHFLERIAAYFVIPTALVAIAGGPIAGAGAAMFSMLLFLVAAGISAGTTDSTGPASPAMARLVALVFTGMLVGWATHPGDGRSQTEPFRVADGRRYARMASRARKLRFVS
jgi:hypothetical protein